MSLSDESAANATNGKHAADVRARRHRRDGAVVARQVVPWAMRHAWGGVDLLCVYYEREMEKPLDELRRELRVEPLVLSTKK